MIRTVFTRNFRDACCQKPVASTSPTNKKCCSSLTVSRYGSGQSQRALTAFRLSPSVRHLLQPPLGSVRLFTYPCLQKKHSRRSFDILITLSPGFTEVTSAPLVLPLPSHARQLFPGTAHDLLMFNMKITGADATKCYTHGASVIPLFPVSLSPAIRLRAQYMCLT